MIYLEQGWEPASWLWLLRESDGAPVECLNGTWLWVSGRLHALLAKGEKGGNLAIHNFSGKRNPTQKLVWGLPWWRSG